MATALIGYPGGKYYLAPWILDHIPGHKTYVEPFCGGCSVFLQKDPSPVEVVNDRDGNLVQFYEVLRDRTEDLVEWLRQVPYAKDLHEKYAGEFYAGYRPDDPIERAGRFFYLRYTQYAGKYRTKSGFASAARRNKAQKLVNSREDLFEFADRFEGVQIENRDYEVMFDRFDEPETFFYCDPPYVEEGDALYRGDEFDHARFVEVLEQATGKWAVSYMDLPPGLDTGEYTIVSRESSQFMNKSHDTRRESGVERLVMNYDPTEEPTFTREQTLDAFEEVA